MQRRDQKVGSKSLTMTLSVKDTGAGHVQAWPLVPIYPARGRASRFCVPKPHVPCNASGRGCSPALLAWPSSSVHSSVFACHGATGRAVVLQHLPWSPHFQAELLISSDDPQQLH
mmetsp:Transcript_9134/g.25550  ORF Transcript_9134/g.25550 Transcript_9134/m.25550 type:complete len:115 (-) Transcript_9134:571-915(-)